MDMKQRYHRLDNWRGITLVSMVCYHLAWDVVYLFGKDWDWFSSTGACLWQQSICCSFIFLSGFCFPLGSHPAKRGAKVFLCGALVSAVTILWMSQDRVLFGILTFLGSAMLFLAAIERWAKRLPAEIAAGACAFLFFWTKNINVGFLGFFGVGTIQLPTGWYRDLFTAYLGFPYPEFFSTDYFSFFPWFFLFLAGYFAARSVTEHGKMDLFLGREIPGIAQMGRQSLLIYLLHQPILYAILSICHMASFL